MVDTHIKNFYHLRSKRFLNVVFSNLSVLHSSSQKGKFVP